MTARTLSRRFAPSARGAAGGQAPAALLALAVAFGAIAIVARARTDRPLPPPDTVAQVKRFVEQERGLAFRHPVRVVRLDDAAFERALTRSEAWNVDRPANRAAFAILEALGELPRGSDPKRVLVGTQAAATFGFYDARQHRLVVRGHGDGPAARVTIAHELTHALDDQWFGLFRPSPRDDGREFAFGALIEGNARRIEIAYVTALDPTEQKLAARQQGAQLARAEGHGPPPAISEIFGALYAYGPALVAAFRDRGGQPALDAAFRRPPATAWEVLFPRERLAPLPVPAPRAGGRAEYRGTLGAFRLAMLAGGTDAPRGRAAAHAWAGDAYVTWSEHGRPCARIIFATRQPRAIARAVAGHGAVSTGARRVTLSTCA